jgi:HAD superfamily hydrolase (TIGR01484 family)
MTFSGLGQDAELENKQAWDPNEEKRKQIKSLLDKKLNGYEIRIAGTTSIDITLKGLDKAYGIQKMVEYIKVSKDEILFVGDSLFPGGNDNPVISTGVKTISVKNPEETKRIILQGRESQGSISRVLTFDS